MFLKFFKILIICGMVLALAYAGACVYANFIHDEESAYNAPSEKKARYEIIVRNTRNVFYTNQYYLEGPIITLDGYWEFTGDKFEYRDKQISLNKKTFGEIIINRR